MSGRAIIRPGLCEDAPDDDEQTVREIEKTREDDIWAGCDWLQGNEFDYQPRELVVPRIDLDYQRCGRGSSGAGMKLQ